MSDFMADMKARRERETAIMAEIADIARKQGLVLVKVSERRFIVVKVNPYGGISSIDNNYFTYLSGEIVFGPAKYGDCRQYICDNVEPLPEKLVKEGLNG